MLSQILRFFRGTVATFTQLGKELESILRTIQIILSRLDRLEELFELFLKVFEVKDVILIDEEFNVVKNLTLTAGEKKFVTATAVDVNGSPAPVQGAYNWDNPDSETARIGFPGGSEKILIEAIKSGTVNITVTATSLGGNSITSTLSVTVIPAPQPEAVDINLEVSDVDTPPNPGS